MLIFHLLVLHNFVAGADFTPGQYTATFTSGATTATASIPIVADDINEPTEQFSLRLYIDGAGYGMGLQKGIIATATVSILLSKFVYIYLTDVRISISCDYNVSNNNNIKQL